MMIETTEQIPTPTEGHLAELEQLTADLAELHEAAKQPAPWSVRQLEWAAKLKLIEQLADRLPGLVAWALELHAERNRQAVEAKRWHDTYQQTANANDEFFGELLDMLPGAADKMVDAYDGIPNGIKDLAADRDRLAKQADAVRVIAAEASAEADRIRSYADEARERGHRQKASRLENTAGVYDDMAARIVGALNGGEHRG